jgi:hypothetical protein
MTRFQAPNTTPAIAAGKTLQLPNYIHLKCSKTTLVGVIILLKCISQKKQPCMNPNLIPSVPQRGENRNMKSYFYDPTLACYVVTTFDATDAPAASNQESNPKDGKDAKNVQRGEHHCYHPTRTTSQIPKHAKLPARS